MHQEPQSGAPLNVSAKKHPLFLQQEILRRQNSSYYENSLCSKPVHIMKIVITATSLAPWAGTAEMSSLPDVTSQSKALSDWPGSVLFPRSRLSIKEGTKSPTQCGLGTFITTIMVLISALTDVGK